MYRPSIRKRKGDHGVLIRGLLTTALAFVLGNTAFAVDDEDATSILAASTGNWAGELYYLDYQSGERFGIPMRVDADMTPDRSTLVRRLTFTDPGSLVYAVNVATIDRDSGELVETYFREGKAEFARYLVTEMSYESAEQWRIVYEIEGIDDDRPARIRHTVRRDRDRMTSSKEVMFLDSDSEFFLRNGTDLRVVRPEIE